MLLKYPIVVCLFSILAGIAPIDAAPPGFVEGHLKIISPKEVELADGNGPGTLTAETYAEFPLIVRSRDGQKEVTRVTADGNGNYRVALPPGEYVLDVAGRRPGHVRARPQSFTIVSSQTLRVDMDVDTGVR
jgi:hypothetical protein